MLEVSINDESMFWAFSTNESLVASLMTFRSEVSLTLYKGAWESSWIDQIDQGQSSWIPDLILRNFETKNQFKIDITIIFYNIKNFQLGRINIITGLCYAIDDVVKITQDLFQKLLNKAFRNQFSWVILQIKLDRGDSLTMIFSIKTDLWFPWAHQNHPRILGKDLLKNG